MFFDKALLKFMGLDKGSEEIKPSDVYFKKIKSISKIKTLERKKQND